MANERERVSQPLQLFTSGSNEDASPSSGSRRRRRGEVLMSSTHHHEALVSRIHAEASHAALLQLHTNEGRGRKEREESSG